MWALPRILFRQWLVLDWCEYYIRQVLGLNLRTAPVSVVRGWSWPIESGPVPHKHWNKRTLALGV